MIDRLIDRVAHYLRFLRGVSFVQSLVRNAKGNCETKLTLEILGAKSAKRETSDKAREFDVFGQK